MVKRRDFLRRSSLATLPGLLAGTGGAWLGHALETMAATAGKSHNPADVEILFHWNKFLTVHTHLRVLASKQADPPPAYADPVGIYRRQMGLVPGRDIWFTMESYIAKARDVAALRGQLTTFPYEFRSYDLEPTGKAIAEAILEAMPAFDGQEWPALEKRRSNEIEPMLESVFEPNKKKLIQFMLTSLNAGAIPVRRVDVNLVQRYLLTGFETKPIHGRYFTIVETGRFSTEELLETLVMVLGRIIELDDRANAHGALFMLRERQRSLGIPNPALLPRALLYWTAGEAVRRVVNPEHRHVGETRGIYQRALRRFLPALEQYWTPYLDGGLSLDEALNGMIRLVAES
jgi:hypothetical protein